MKVKGTAVSTMPEFIKEYFGNSGHERWLKALSPQAKDVYSSKILLNEWFPLKEILTEPTEKMCELFYSGDPKGAIECGHFSAEKALKGIYHTFVRLGSPEFIAKCATIILPTYFEPSKITVQSIEKGKVAIRIIEFPEISKVVEYRIFGWIERATVISGGKRTSVKLLKSMCDNHPYSELEITWS
jgi:hypothetical protein